MSQLGFDGRTVNPVCLVCGRSRVRFPKAGQILHSVANGSPPLQHLRRKLRCLCTMTLRWAQPTRYRRNTASIMKGLVWAHRK